MAHLPNRRSIRMRGYDYASEGAYLPAGRQVS